MTNSRTELLRLKLSLLQEQQKRRDLWRPNPGPQKWAYESKADIIGFGGAAGGGKTDLLLGFACTRHRRSLLLRRELKQGRGLVDRSRELFVGLGRFSETTGIWRDLPGGRQIELGGCKDPGDEQAHKGRPKDLLGIDEADQFTESVVRFLMGWVRTTAANQPCRTVLCFNPPCTAEGRWLLTFFGPWIDRKYPRPAQPGELRWYATLKNGVEVERPDGSPFTDSGETIQPKSRTFFPARVQDNPALMATGYLSTLLSMPEPLRSQLAYGDMEAGIQDDAWQVIPTAWVEAAQSRWTVVPPAHTPKAGPSPHAVHPLTCLGVDVAYGGADATVISARRGPWFAPLKKYRGAVTDSGLKASFLVLKEHDGACIIHVDAIGYGASCHEHLREKVGRLAVAVNVAEATDWHDRSKKYRLTNLRTAMYWLLREALDPETGDGLALPPDPELLADLTAPRFEVRASGIVVEPKERIKERIGRSPDCGDAVALAHLRQRTLAAGSWGLERI